MSKQTLIWIAAAGCVLCAPPSSLYGQLKSSDKKSQGGLVVPKKELQDGTKNNKTKLLDINKLLETVIPSLECKDETLQRVMTEVSKKSGVPINIAGGVPVDVTVTMSFDNIPAGEAIRYICAGAGVSYKITSTRVVVGAPQAGKKE